MPRDNVSIRRRAGARRKGVSRFRSTTALVAAAVGVVALLGVVVLVVQVAGRGSTEPERGIDNAARETQLIAGVEVREPWVDHRTFPLDTPVGHEWLLRNIGPRTVSLGQSTIETLEGC